MARYGSSAGSHTARPVMHDDDIRKTADLLRQFEPGFLPYPVFEQVARLVAMPVVEFIPLRNTEGRVEVLLIDRGPSDPFWPNMLHTPGTVVRATDFGSSSGGSWPAFQRIMHDELKDVALGSPLYVGSLFHKSKRGVEQAQLYAVEVIGQPLVGKFYPVDALPTSLIDSQKVFIAEAARYFQNHTK
jgi:hypothetical protein